MLLIEFLLGLLIGIYIAWKLSSLAARLDRTHVRRDNALNSLRQHLALRASCVARLIATAKLELDTAEKLRSGLEAVLDASEISFRDYLFAESELTKILCDELDDFEKISTLMSNTAESEIVFDLARATKRVQLARRFHNDAVGASQLLHARTAVRLFRLAGHTKPPTTVDLDDRVPNALQDL